MRRNLFTLSLMLYLVLGCWKGYVALFEGGSTEPKRIFPYPVSSLPSEDQAALEEGIIIRNDSQLQQALEDYLS